MNLTIEYAGTTRTLAKHPAIARALRLGQLTPQAAAAKPWYLRLTVHNRERLFRLPAKNKEALRAARDILKGRLQRPDQFTAFLEAQDARRGLTLGQLAADWTAAGLPYRKTAARDPLAASRLRATLDRALPWWTARTVASVTPSLIEDYAAHRSPALRSADLELSALSSLCQWAVLTERITANPFADRDSFAKVKAHCHEASPDTDDTLHRVLAWLFDPAAPLPWKLAGGTLAWCALTGLRPGEPAMLQRHPHLDTPPPVPKTLPPGATFLDRENRKRMRVERLKRGQNPFITVHPPAESFLCAWKAWLARHLPDSDRLFPLGEDVNPDQTLLNRALNAASAALTLPHYRPHGFGRAYYVKVRRSQGIDDAQIAGELGQASKGDLIRSVYGDPGDLVGGALFDWLPDSTPPAWELLSADRPTPAASNPATVLLRPATGKIGVG